MMDELSDARQVPRGMLRIISSFGFGRRVVAPALSALAKEYPQLELRFDVEDRLVDMVNEGVDLDIRIGDDIAPNLIARKLATNYRILCASPEFLTQHGTPKQLNDLATLPIEDNDFLYDTFLAAGEDNNAKLIAEYFRNNGIEERTAV